jgi:drug/metabolite transporter (DMT)-like permease
MTTRDILAALSVAIVWGLSFIAIKVGVGETTPLMLAALRFLFAAVPFVFFLAPPKAPAWAVALYGLMIGVGQFGLLFLAIHDGFPAGLASLVIMAQVFFTILLAWLLLGERPRRSEIAGAIVAFVGIAVIGSERLAGASMGPFLLVILAAVFWGSGNVLAKAVGKVDMLSLHHLVQPRRASAALAPFPFDGRDGRSCRAHPSGVEARHQRADGLVCRHGVRIRPVGAAPGAIFRGDRRTVRAARAGSWHDRRGAPFRRGFDAG